MSDIRTEIFRMPDSEDEFCETYPFLASCRADADARYRAVSRRKEVLAERVLIERLFPGEDVQLMHNADGKPLLSNGVNVSISHTRNHIAMMVSPSQRVALDIEHVSDRVMKVRRMFLRDDEPFDDVKRMLVAWCAKETIYKYFSEMKLAFDEIRVRDFVCGDRGLIVAENLRSGELVSLDYMVCDEYVLVHTL